MTFIICASPLPVSATPLIADMSTYRIDMDAYFSGTRLFLFGALGDNGDIVIALRGPAKDYIMRKKERIAGIWVNSSRMKFFSIPSFYAIAASKPLPDIERSAIFRRLGIGEHNLLFPSPDPRTLVHFKEFSQAFLDYQHARNRYTGEVGGIEFMGETLFKTVVEFPDNIPPGNYTAEIYLVSDGQIVGQQTLPLAVVKAGLEAWLYNFAHDRPWLYGLMAVALALASGWLAGRVFEKI